jgi:hypothetical protein
MKKILAMTLVSLASAAGTANASLVLESEPNNTAATADPIGTFNIPGGSIVIDGTITPGTLGTPGTPGTAGDVDWFSFTVRGSTMVVASIYSLNLGATGNSELWLVDSSGTVLAFNDDGNPGGGQFMSSIFNLTLAPGDYFLVVSGDNDSGATTGGTTLTGPDAAAVALPDGFEGATTQVDGHTQSFDYKFVIGFNVVPTPGAAALLGLGGLMLARRRR